MHYFLAKIFPEFSTQKLAGVSLIIALMYGFFLLLLTGFLFNSNGLQAVIALTFGILFLFKALVTRRVNTNIRDRLFLINVVLCNASIVLSVSSIEYCIPFFLANLLCISVFISSFSYIEKISWFVFGLAISIVGYSFKPAFLTELASETIQLNGHIQQSWAFLGYAMIIFVFLLYQKVFIGHKLAINHATALSDAIFNGIPQLILIVDGDNKITKFNNFYKQHVIYLFGRHFQKGDLLIDFLIDETYHHSVLKAVKLARGGQTISANATVKIGKIGTRIIELIYAPFNGSKTEEVIILLTDKTDQLQEQINLITLKQALDSFNAPFLVAKPDDSIVFANKSGNNLLLQYQGNCRKVPPTWAERLRLSNLEGKPFEIQVSGELLHLMGSAGEGYHILFGAPPPRPHASQIKQANLLDALPFDAMFLDLGGNIIWTNLFHGSEAHAGISLTAFAQHLGWETKVLAKRKAYYEQCLYSKQPISWVDTEPNSSQKAQVYHLFFPILTNRKLNFVAYFSFNFGNSIDFAGFSPFNNEFVRNVLDILPLSVFLVDCNGKYLFVNETAARMAGYTPYQMEGKSIEQLFQPNLVAHFKEADALIWRDSMPVFYEDRIPFLNNERHVIAGKKLVELDGSQYLLGFNLDITQNKNIEKALMASKSLVEQIIEVSPSLIYIKDENGVFLHVNQAVANLFNLSQEDILGKTVFDLHGSPADNDSYQMHDKLVFDKGEAITFEEYFNAPNGNIRTFQTVKMPIMDGSGKRRLLGMSTEITTQKEHQTELNKLIAEKDDLNSKYFDTTRNLIHDLNGPIAVLEKIITKHLLLGKQTDDTLNALLQLNIAQNRVCISQYQNAIWQKQFGFKSVGFQFPKAMLLAAEPLLPLLKIADLQWVFPNDSNDDWVFGDEFLTSFLAKSVWICIATSCNTLALMRCKASTRTSDIDCTAFEWQFETNYEVNFCINTELQSLLASLNIPMVCNSNGFKHHVEICFPLKPISNPFQKVAQSAFNLKTLKILVAEDSKINQLLIRKLFQSLEIAFEMAEHGNEVLTLLKHAKFDLILMDLQMPILDGYETTMAIRNGAVGERLKSIPIIALTSETVVEAEVSFLKKGFNGFIEKPLSYSHFEYIIPQVLLNSQSAQ